MGHLGTPRFKIENNRYAHGMTKLGSLVTGGSVTFAVQTGAGYAIMTGQAPPFDLGTIVASLNAVPAAVKLPGSLTATIDAWINQDDDAHEPCSLTACRHPLHPGPCKGWKGTLHSVAPGTYHQIEGERVRKANERRLKRIADLKAQNKPIPRRLLEEIKPKPAPVAAVPSGQVGQKADLAGGQAHVAGQAVSHAAGVQVKTAPPLPLGPKQKKPTVAGRGPAFVITQPKVTDQYKLDKAAKITPSEWASLSAADKKAIRDELEAIKVRGFGPQQKKADELLAKFPAASTLGTPGPAISQPGKVSLGQATKAIPSTPSSAPAAPTTPAAPSASGRPAKFVHSVVGPDGKTVTRTSHREYTHASVVRLSNGDKVVWGFHGSEAAARSATLTSQQKKNGMAVIDALPVKREPLKNGSAAPSAPSSPTPPSTPAVPAAPTAPDVTSMTPVNVTARIRKDGFADLVIGGKTIRTGFANGNHPGTLTMAPGGGYTVTESDGTKHHIAKGQHVQVAKADTGAKPAPNVLSPQAQQARAVAGRATGRPTSKAHLDAYGKLTKDDFDSLDATTQRTIRDDLANAKAKFLDPKKQQAAADLLARFGSRHTTPAPGAPATPAHPKGYSDPQQQAVKAVASGLVDTDEVLKRVGALSQTAVKGLDDADRKQLLGRLAFIAVHQKATQAQKERAIAYGRIINKGPASSPGKLDHEPSLGELHTHEQKTGANLITDALNAATAKTGLTPGTQRADRIKALSALSKAQFDSLGADDQRKITDALQELHSENSGYSKTKTPDDKIAEDALVTYTGHHPAIARLKQAEADFRAGKIQPRDLYHELLSARVQVPARHQDPDGIGGKLEKEAQRIAEDNPAMPFWLRATLIDNPYSGKRGNPYDVIGQLSMEHSWNAAPRLSQSDMRALFTSTDADLAGSHPIHVAAIKAYRQHVISSGLASGSPWSTATKSQLVDSLTNTGYSSGHVVTDDRMKMFNELPAADQMKVRTVLADRILAQTNNRAKTGTDITLRQLQGHPYTGDKLDAALAATDNFAGSTVQDTYRKLDPADFQSFPQYTQEAIKEHLDELQTRAERNGPVSTWTPQDNPLKVFPAALKAHLDGTRTQYADRRLRNASDVANYGQKIINPLDRADVYAATPIAPFKTMSQADQDKITADLVSIATDGSLGLPLRYQARFTDDFTHGHGHGRINANQLVAISAVDPRPGNTQPDNNVLPALNTLSKTEYDGLDKVYRETIDERIKSLPGADQQVLTAKFHPAAAANNPSGVTPTTVQPNVPPHVQNALDTIYGVHPKSHTMAHQLSTYGALRGSDFAHLNPQEQSHLLSDLSFIHTTAKGPSATKAKLLIDRFTPAGTPSGQVPPQPIIPPANAVPGQVRYATPLKGLAKKPGDRGKNGDRWITIPGGRRVWGEYGASGLLLKHTDPATGEERYLMVQRGPAISDPGKWTFPGGASESKETPHQGAARETIEELGLKDDALKDAEVHGDFTYTVPNHPWKYTSVAVSVPTMIKPNLSTAHARAETSDAKWMTLDEIRALDKSGDLHHPIAGGLLEKNVISLYPPGGGQKLGQVARPGPVTKRQGRMFLPPGGRVPPANFNAWTAPHKPSRGKNLVGTKADIDAQRQKIKQDRTLYDGKTADGRLAAIGAQQGFDDTPTVMEKKDIDRLLATGDYIEAWRGVTGAGGGWSARGRGASGGKTAKEINEEMRSGPAYYGKGIFGNGYYLATDKAVAKQYADGTTGSIVRILIPKAAVTEQYDKVRKDAEAHSSPHSQAKGSGRYETSTFWDPGRWGAAKGIDGIEILPHHRAQGGGGASHVARHGKPAFNWLNRSVLIIQKEPG